MSVDLCCYGDVSRVVLAYNTFPLVDGDGVIHITPPSSLYTEQWLTFIYGINRT